MYRKEVVSLIIYAYREPQSRSLEEGVRAWGIVCGDILITAEHTDSFASARLSRNSHKNCFFHASRVAFACMFSLPLIQSPKVGVRLARDTTLKRHNVPLGFNYWRM